MEFNIVSAKETNETLLKWTSQLFIDKGGFNEDVVRLIDKIMN